LTRAIIQKRYKKYFCPRKKQETEAEAEAMCPKLLVVLKLKNTHMQKKYQPLKKKKKKLYRMKEQGSPEEKEAGGESARREQLSGLSLRGVKWQANTHSWRAEKEELH